MPYYFFSCEICKEPVSTYRSPSKPAPKRCRYCNPGCPRPLSSEQVIVLQEAYATKGSAGEALDYCMDHSVFKEFTRGRLKGWAIRMGITHNKFSDRKWTPEKLEELQKLIGYHPKKIREIFARKGIQYSEGGIAKQIRRLGYSTRPDGFTPEELGEILGCNRVTIGRWIKQGKICAKRYNAEGVSEIGSKQWISPKEVVHFLRTYPELISGRILDFALLVSLLDEFPLKKRKEAKSS